MWGWHLMTVWTVLGMAGFQALERLTMSHVLAVPVTARVKTPGHYETRRCWYC